MAPKPNSFGSSTCMVFRDPRLNTALRRLEEPQSQGEAHTQKVHALHLASKQKKQKSLAASATGTYSPSAERLLGRNRAPGGSGSPTASRAASASHSCASSERSLRVSSRGSRGRSMSSGRLAGRCPSCGCCTCCGYQLEEPQSVEPDSPTLDGPQHPNDALGTQVPSRKALTLTSKNLKSASFGDSCGTALAKGGKWGPHGDHDSSSVARAMTWHTEFPFHPDLGRTVTWSGPGLAPHPDSSSYLPGAFVSDNLPHDKTWHTEGQISQMCHSYPRIGPVGVAMRRSQVGLGSH